MSAGDILYRPMGSSKQGQQSLVYNIELVDKVVHVLEVLRDAPEGLTLEDLTIRTGYVKSSIHRALASLRWHGYVEQAVARGKYRLGIKCLLLARGLQGSVELLPHPRAYLREIVDAFDESAYLAILRGGRGIFVEVVETRRRDLRLVGRGRLPIMPRLLAKSSRRICRLRHAERCYSAPSCRH